MYILGKNSPKPRPEPAMTATSLFIHAGFITGLALALLTGLALA